MHPSLVTTGNGITCITMRQDRFRVVQILRNEERLSAGS